jgi:casein kinase 1
VELAYYFHYCKNLKFEDRPDYNSLKGLLFDIIMSKETITSSPPEFMFDWFIDDENPEDNNINNENQLEVSFKIYFFKNIFYVNRNIFLLF